MAVRCNLKVILVQRKLSQQWLAERVDVSHTTINAICNERSFPSMELGLKISETLNLSIHEIWELEK